MNAEKRATALKVLSDNQNALLAFLEKVDTNLFVHQPAERWSIAELVEHIILVEKGVLGGIQKAGTKPKEAPINKPLAEEKFRQLMRNRTRKIEAPTHFIPKGIFIDKATAIAAFNTHRVKVTNFVNTTDIALTHVGFPHMALGMLNGIDWIVFMAGHCERHILQMEEISVEG